MSLTATTLSADLSASVLVANVTAATGATVGGFIQINDEFAIIDTIAGTAIGLKQRGFYGTVAKAHDILSRVTFGLAADLPAVSKYLPKFPKNIVTIGENGTIPLPTEDTIFVITKATALASSALADPTTAQDGLIVRFHSLTNAAHVVTTITAHDGTTGLHTTFTMPAFIGASFSLRAIAGKWLVEANNLTVIT
jgi:hypothetical protein